MTQDFHFVDGKFITFDLNHEEYAISLGKILEILGAGGIRDLDHENPCFRGVIFIRDQKVRILDLRCRFGFEPRAKKEDSSVLVAVFEPGFFKVGLMVDSVRQVVHIKSDFLKKTPAEKNDIRDELIWGRVEVEGRTIRIFNSDKLGQYLGNLCLAQDAGQSSWLGESNVV
jgi:purine-binding chemotaxis protein CheW